MRTRGEGTVYQRPNGTWTAQVTTPAGRRARTFPTQRKAREWLTRQRRDMDTGEYVEPSDMPLGEWWDKWVKAYKTGLVVPSTLDSYRYSKRRLSQTLLDAPIGRITRADIQTALNRLVASRRTVEITRTAQNGALPPMTRATVAAKTHPFHVQLQPQLQHGVPGLSHTRDTWQVAQVRGRKIVQLLRYRHIDTMTIAAYNNDIRQREGNKMYSYFSDVTMSRVTLTENLTGTEKQIDYGMSCKLKMVARVSEVLANAARRSGKVDLAKDLEAKMFSKVDEITEAKWWIENRMMSDNDMAKAFLA